MRTPEELLAEYDKWSESAFRSRHEFQTFLAGIQAEARAEALREARNAADDVIREAVLLGTMSGGTGDRLMDALRALAAKPRGGE